MSIDFTAIAKDLVTWASAAKLAGGAFVHKAYQYLKAKFWAAEKAVSADIKKL